MSEPFRCTVLMWIVALVWCDTVPVPCFISMGDWGGENSHVASMAQHMEAVAESPLRFGCSTMNFVLALGDNFYPSGVESIDDPKWKSVYAEQFRRGRLQNVTFFVVLGNHDFGDGGSGFNRSKGYVQVMYYRERDPLWYLPDVNYTTLQKLGNVSVLLVVINSEAIDLCARNSRFCFQEDQLAWVNETLALASTNASIDAIFLIAHHNPVSPVGGHVNYAYDHMILPLLRQYRVSAVLAGHSHFISWAQEKKLVKPDGTPSEYGDELWYLANGAARGSSAYPCDYQFIGVDPYADITNRACQSAAINGDGAFMIHRVGQGGMTHCVVDSLSGAVGQCLATRYRSSVPSPGKPVPATSSAVFYGCVVGGIIVVLIAAGAAVCRRVKQAKGTLRHVSVPNRDDCELASGPIVLTKEQVASLM